MHQYTRPGSNGPKALWNSLMDYGAREEAKEPRDSFCEGDQTDVTRDHVKEHIEELCDLKGMVPEVKLLGLGFMHLC